jgi:hypothetical protein
MHTCKHATYIHAYATCSCSMKEQNVSERKDGMVTSTHINMWSHLYIRRIALQEMFQRLGANLLALVLFLALINTFDHDNQGPQRCKRRRRVLEHPKVVIGNAGNVYCSNMLSGIIMMMHGETCPHININSDCQKSHFVRNR